MLLELSKVEQGYDAVVAIVRDGLQVTEVAEKFGVHRDTVKGRDTGVIPARRRRDTARPQGDDISPTGGAREEQS